MHLSRQVNWDDDIPKILPTCYPILDIHSIHLMNLSPKQGGNKHIHIDKCPPIITLSEITPCNQQKRKRL